MLIITIKANPLAHFKQAFTEEFKQLAKIVRKEDGCLEYELYQKDLLATELFLFERWDSQEALDAHMKTEHMEKFFTLTKEWFGTENEMKIYQVEHK